MPGASKEGSKAGDGPKGGEPKGEGPKGSPKPEGGNHDNRLEFVNFFSAGPESMFFVDYSIEFHQ